MPTESNKIIDMIFEIMREKEISQTELSNRLHWTKSKLSKVLNSQQRLTTDDLFDLSAALGIANPAILMKADVDAVDDKFFAPGQITETMKMFERAEEYNEQKNIIENKIAPVFSTYLSLMSDGRVARTKDNRTMFNSSSRRAFEMRGETIPIHWGVMVRDINPLVDKTNRLTVGMWWNGNRDVVYLAIVLKEYVPLDNELIEEFHNLIERKFDTWSMEKRVEEIPFFRRGLICNKVFKVDNLYDELKFKSELLNAYDLYTELVEYYMDMVMYGFTESRKEVAELKKVEEARNIVQLKNNAIALKKADYTCEFNPAHESFINPKTGEKFMKAIHLIPVCKQNQIDADLSCVANICCLCSTCADHIKFGTDADRQEMLMQLYLKHKNDLETAGINLTLMQVFKFNDME